MDAENFVPWSQIEPLLKPGMTFKELGALLRARIGLEHGYEFITRPAHDWERAWEVVRDGITLVKTASIEVEARRGGDEVIA